jgi:hypothetical protein
MELELKHLTPYLPHKIKGQTKDTKTVFEITGFNDRGHITTYGDLGMGTFKTTLLLLHPLNNFCWDDLKKVKEFIGLGRWCEAYDHYFDIWFYRYSNTDKFVLQMPYIVLQYFLSNHFDVFGLIDAGLAVEKK